MIFCFSCGMPIPVSATSKATTEAAFAENRMIVAPSAAGIEDREPDAALLGELERIGEQILEHLLEALGVGDQAAAQMRVGVQLEGELAVLCLVAEGPGDHLQHAGEEDLLRFDGDGAGFDLREIEDVADEIQQVGSGAVNGARELDLLGSEVAVGVVAELLAEHQNAVERRAEFVRHVGEEFRFVFRSEGEFLGLFFEGAAGLLDFLVLALDFDVLLGQLLCLLRELLVGLLELFLLRLKLGCQLLRLLEQSLCLHGGFDTVQHDADAGGELFKEGQDARR